MVRELRIALLISLGTVGVGGCLSSLDERDLENRNDGGTAGVTNAGTGGASGSSAGGTSGKGGSGGAGATSGNAGTSSGKGGTAGSTASGGSAGTDSDAGGGGSAGDDTPAAGGTSGDAGSGGDSTGSGGTDNNGGEGNSSGSGGTGGSGNSSGNGGNGGSGNASGTGGDGGMGGTAAGVGGNAGSTAGVGGAAGSTTLPPIEDGEPGFLTRYWDCCKPTCAWTANVPDGTPAESCNASDTVIAATSQSACTGGPAYACHDLSPWAANEQLSYGYVAAANAECGRCFEFQFTGSGHSTQGDAGSAVIQDKHMFVQVVSAGGDVGSNQFDLLIPGGGVGLFNACSAQLGVNASALGAQYGGFASDCNTTGSDLATRRACVRAKCASVFDDAPGLRAGCEWFVDWMSVADNPNLVFREVDCPAELIHRSGLDGGF